MAQNRVYVPPDRPQFWIFPVKEDFCSDDDHHCLKVMLMNELHTTEVKAKITIIQYFIV